MCEKIKNAKILIVEDEPQINRLIELVLQSAGYYKIFKAYDGREALDIIKTKRPDLVLLDAMIPYIDGFSLCKIIKKDLEFNFIKIIMLTARKMENDILLGFENGAVDYISKPFSNKILLARIKACLENYAFNRSVTSYRDITLDDDKKIVKIKDSIINLTKFEYIILQTFINNTGIVYSRSQLLSYLRGNDGFDISERAIDVQILNLRKKLGEYGDYIETVRGIGYKLKELD